MEKRKNIATKKSMVVQFVLLGICTAGTAFSQTLALKANIGVCACWDAVGLNVYQIFGIKVGTVSMCLHAVCVLVQFLIQRKDFEKRKILQLPYVIVFGMLLNFFYYNVLTFEVHAYVAKVLLVITSYLGLGLFLGPMLLLNLSLFRVKQCVMCSADMQRWITQRFGLDWTEYVSQLLWCCRSSVACPLK